MPSGIIKFEDFALDCDRFELHRSGQTIKIEKLPMELLILLVEKGGHLVTRQEIVDRLWGQGVFLDTEHGINTAVRKLRNALRDNPAQSRFVQTVTGKGYRFIARTSTLSSGPNGNNGSAGIPLGTMVLAESKFRLPFIEAALANWAWVTIGIVLVATAIGAGTLRHRTESAPVIPVPFTAFSGLETSPTFSPDGSQIAFAWSGGQPSSKPVAFDLYTKAIGSEESLRLTTQPAKWISPAWSPDGRQIAFHRISKDNTGLYLISALGGPEKKLRSTRAVNSNAQISWSPDRKYIAYADSLTPDGQSRIFLLSPETLESKQIPHVEECQMEFQPVFSSDSKKLAYGCYLRSGGFGLYSMVVPEGSAHSIKTFSGDLLGIAWTGDGGRLVISRHEDGKSAELIEVNATNGSLKKLPFADKGSWPAISPKGDKLAYDVFDQPNVTIWRATLQHSNLASARLISSTRNDMKPQYSPDGKHIAFCSGRGGNNEIWISDEKGMHPTQVSHLGTPVTCTPVWSPDSKQIAFDSRAGSECSIYIVDLVELAPHRLITNLANMAHPWWSRDGKSIYFLGGSDDSLGERIYQSPASGGNAAPVSISRGTFPEEAPDGTAVYFSRNTGGIWNLIRASLTEPHSESVVKEVSPIRFSGDFTVVRDGIYFVPANSPHTINYFDLASRKITPVVNADNSFFVGLSVSPERRWLLFTQIEGAGSDIMLVDHFR